MKKTAQSLILGLCLALAPSSHAASSLPEIIQNLGFHPLNSPIADFSLPNMDGQTKALSGFQGKWTWLTFFATWCGACGVQMPFLETFHVRFKEDGIKVLAVSIDDDDKSVLLNYLKKKELTFEVLHDKKNRVASLYKAQSIPTTYLISPDQKIAGVARGAIDWSSPEKIRWAEKLLQFDALGAPGTSPTPNKIQNELAPPTVEISSARQVSFTGQYVLEVKISWPGDPRNYILKVPKVDLPDKLKLRNVNSKSSSAASGQESHLLYLFEIGVPAPGKYLIGPVELSYQDRQTLATLDTRVEAIEVEFFPSEHLGLKIALGLTIGLLGLCGAGLFLSRRKKKMDHEKSQKRSAMLKKKKRAETYQQLQKQKLSGNETQYACEILQLLIEINPEQATIFAELRDKIRFAGIQLDAVKMRQYEKQIEKALEDGDLT